MRIGTSEWLTSLFPDNARKSYVLPVKEAVRVAEDLGDGTSAQVIFEVVTDEP